MSPAGRQLQLQVLPEAGSLWTLERSASARALPLGYPEIWLGDILVYLWSFELVLSVIIGTLFTKTGGSIMIVPLVVSFAFCSKHYPIPIWAKYLPIVFL